MGNKILDYFISEVQGNPAVTSDNLSTLESLILDSTDEEVIGAVACAVCFESGALRLLDAYKNNVLTDEVLEYSKNKITEVGGAAFDNGGIFTSEKHREALLECNKILENALVIRDSDTYIYENTLKILQDEVNENERRIVLEGPSLGLTREQVLETTLVLTQSQFNVEFVKAFMSPDDQFSLESVNSMIRLSNRYDDTLAELIVLEEDKHDVEVKKNGKTTNRNGSSIIKKTSNVIDSGSRKATNAIRKGGAELKSSTAGIKKAGGRFKSLLSGTVDRLDKMNKEERMEAILRGGMRRRVSTVLRTAILTGAAYAVNPALGLITLLTSSAVRRDRDIRLKEQVRSEYKAEIKLVQEKIRDAEAAGDRKKKYELMRIQNHLERNIERLESPGFTNRSRLTKG